MVSGAPHRGTKNCRRPTALPRRYWVKSTRLLRIPPKLLPSSPCLNLEFPNTERGSLPRHCRGIEARRQLETRHQKRRRTSDQRLKLDGTPPLGSLQISSLDTCRLTVHVSIWQRLLNSQQPGLHSYPQVCSPFGKQPVRRNASMLDAR